MFDMIIECGCGTCNNVNTNTILKKDVVCLKSNENLRITYFECRDCKERNIVQIDNNETIVLLKLLTKKVAKMSRFKKNHKQMSEKEITSISKIRTDLAEIRFNLKKENQGMQYKDGDKIYDMNIVQVGEPNTILGDVKDGH